MSTVSIIIIVCVSMFFGAVICDVIHVVRKYKIKK